MRRFIALCILTLVAHQVRAEPSTPTPAPRGISPRLRGEMRALFPAFDPTVARKPETATHPDAPADGVITLPEMEVEGNRWPRADADEFVAPRELRRKQINAYMDSLQGIDRVLNGFSLPFIGPSVASRAAAKYRTEKMDDLIRLQQIPGADGKTPPSPKRTGPSGEDQFRPAHRPRH